MARRSKRWRRLLEARPHERTRRFDADHTFSSAASMSRVAEATLESVQRLCAAADCVGAGAAVAHSAGRMPAA